LPKELTIDERPFRDEDIDRLIDSLTQELIGEFGHQLPPEAVERLVWETAQAYADSKVQTYVPILVRREARARLRRLTFADAS
jgi:hypothetical protein